MILLVNNKKITKYDICSTQLMERCTIFAYTCSSHQVLYGWPQVQSAVEVTVVSKILQAIQI